jgi:hypothetical protein
MVPARIITTIDPIQSISRFITLAFSKISITQDDIAWCSINFSCNKKKDGLSVNFGHKEILGKPMIFTKNYRKHLRGSSLSSLD